MILGLINEYYYGYWNIKNFIVWERWVILLIVNFFFAFYSVDFSRILLSWRLTKILKESQDLKSEQYEIA
jgi:hypothetical protein